MVFIGLGIIGIFILVALFTLLTRKESSLDNKQEESIKEIPADCCGAHEICEKDLKRFSPTIEYFDDEDLDLFHGIPSNRYKDEQIDLFRDVLYTLRQSEITDWLISLEKRGIELPEILKPEVLQLTTEP